ncbi:MAG: hypothetical protein GY909_09890 [Oligoflexia bacterium]|nr:hypothetical protein [Oligoflexia bacterium]
MEITNKIKEFSIPQGLKRPLLIGYILLLIILGVGSIGAGFLYKFKLVNKLDKYYASLGYPSDVRNKGIIPETLKMFSFFKLNTDQISEAIDIEVKFKHLYKLYNKKNEAIQIGSLISSSDDYVPAKINHQGKKVSMKMRLKGDMLDHLEGRKWSYRVKTKGSQQYKGMRVFSIQHPMTRGYHWEPIFYEFLREFDVITPRYFFTNVTLNGEDIGIMAIEEHFSKEILESQNRRESVILRFDESESRKGLLDGSSHAHMAQNTYIKPFRSSKIMKKANLRSIYLNAVGKLNRYLRKELPASRVFDLDQMALFIAANEIWNAEHGLWWTNMRFYVNPVTMLLEPIAFDNESLHFGQHHNLLFHSVSGIYPVSELMKDLDFRKKVQSKLFLIKEKVDKEGLWKKLEDKEKELRSLLANEFRFIFKIPFIEYQERLEKLVKVSPEEMINEKN